MSEIIFISLLRLLHLQASKFEVIKVPLPQITHIYIFVSITDLLISTAHVCNFIHNSKLSIKEKKYVPRKRHPLMTELSSISSYLKTHIINSLFRISPSKFFVWLICCILVSIPFQGSQNLLASLSVLYLCSKIKEPQKKMLKSMFAGNKTCISEKN